MQVCAYVCVCGCSNVQVYSVGSEDELELAVAVENRGEDAFEATVRIFTPPDVDYVSVSHIAAPVCRRFFKQAWSPARIARNASRMLTCNLTQAVCLRCVRCVWLETASHASFRKVVDD